MGAANEAVSFVRDEIYRNNPPRELELVVAFAGLYPLKLAALEREALEALSEQLRVCDKNIEKRPFKCLTARQPIIFSGKRRF